MVVALNRKLQRARWLTKLEVIWGMMLTGPALVFTANFLLIPASSPEYIGRDDVRNIGHVIGQVAIASLPVTVILGYFLRNQIYKRHWHADAVTPGGYFLGNITLYVCVDGPALLSLMAIAFTDRLWPALLPPVVSAVIVALNVPNGAPMQPQPPRLGEAVE